MLLNRCCRLLLPVFATFTVLPVAAAQGTGGPLAEEIVRAMNGHDRVLGVRTLLLEGTGENYNLGQNAAPDTPLPVFAVTQYWRAFDFANRRWRQEQVREARFFTGNQAPQRQRIGFDAVAFNILASDSVVRAPGMADADRASELLYYPIGFLRRALATGAQLSEQPERDGLRRLQLDADGDEVTMFVDPDTRLPVRICRISNHPLLGDVVLQTELSDWRPSDGLLLPMRIVQRLDEWAVSDIHLTAARVNADVGDLAAPATLRSSPAAGPAVNVTSEEIARGVWYLAGQSHHSVAIEMSDHLLLVEAPQNEARTRAVIARAQALRPGKPVRAVINTHHHFDHAGGIGAAMTEGLTVIAHSRSKDFFEGLAQRSRSAATTTGSAEPMQAEVIGVDSLLVLSDDVRTVEIHHIRGNPHAETLLMVYLPAEKLLIEADVYTPPAPTATSPPPAVFAPNLVENIDRLGLDVERIVPIHGRIVPVGDLRNAAAAASGR